MAVLGLEQSGRDGPVLLGDPPQLVSLARRRGGQAGGLEYGGLVGRADRYDRMGSGSGHERREAG